MKIQTINQLISVWKDIATRHYQLNHFGIGDSWEVGVKANMHPVLWINPVTASMPSSDNGYKTFEIDFEVRVFDLVDKDELNENDVLSDTIDILKDIIAEFKGHPYYVNSQLNIIDDISFESFTEEFDEEVSGWLCEISLMTPVLTTFCGIPSADITGFEFPGIDCPDVNVLCPVYVEDVTGVYPIEVTTIGTTKEVSLAVPVGEINDSSNSGTGEGLALAKSGVDLPFKSIQAGTNITIDSTATDITINASGGGSGEVNTSSNVGTGHTLANAKIGVDLPFKSVKAGTNITITPTATDITIHSTDTGEDNTSSNSGLGEGLALAKVGDDLPFKTITAGTGVTLTPSATELEISTSGGTDTNIGNDDITFDGSYITELAGFNWQIENLGNDIFYIDGYGAQFRYDTLIESPTATPLTIKGNGNMQVSIDSSNSNNSNLLFKSGGSDKFYIGFAKSLGNRFYIYNTLTGDSPISVMPNNDVILGGNSISPAVIGSEDISLQGDTLVKGSDTSASTTGFEVTDSANTSLLDIRNNGDIYTEGLQGINETLTFGGGASGEVATITYTNGIVTGRTLVP